MKKVLIAIFITVLITVCSETPWRDMLSEKDKKRFDEWLKNGAKGPFGFKRRDCDQEKRKKALKLYYKYKNCENKLKEMQKNQSENDENCTCSYSTPETDEESEIVPFGIFNFGEQDGLEVISIEFET
ncbi:CLUMA_CG019792, isoform A [Clunio marinus]|uniref:CLUMA_CG019792, isoform A n=1 Tax=Clunio marinus TaxID=568069 RepID=A0A1J1J2J5_9DIPT|nr:CLUMA_CG019792, isoform A [Clunio marinus]